MNIFQTAARRTGRVQEPATCNLQPATTPSATQSPQARQPSTINHQPSTFGAAFTLIEIAISLAIIGFALVAIIGILPQGINVQKDNRQETIINQDATVLIDAIRNGQHGLDDLTNYVYAITNYWALYTGAGRGQSHVSGYTYTGSSFDGGAMSPNYPINSGNRIVGLLSTPKYVINQNLPATSFYSNYVVAYVHSMSGTASDKYPQSSKDVQDLAFNYRVISEIVPYTDFDKEWTNYTPYVTGSSNSSQNWVWRSNNWLIANQTVANLFDFRLVFRWPLFPSGETGPKRQIYRTIVGGNVIGPTNENGFPSGVSNLYFFQPRTYVKVP